MASSSKLAFIARIAPTLVGELRVIDRLCQKSSGLEAAELGRTRRNQVLLSFGAPGEVPSGTLAERERHFSAHGASDCATSVPELRKKAFRVLCAAAPASRPFACHPLRDHGIRTGRRSGKSVPSASHAAIAQRGAMGRVY